MSRIQNNEDIFNNLIVSDPVISHSRKLMERKKRELTEDANRLLYFSDDDADYDD